jgi:3'(2'), 5'-bisphosphate nucleotidase
VQDLNTFLQGAIALARQAAAAILDIYQDHDIGVTYKADDSPLTRADLASHRIITTGLTELTPDIPIVSEESAHHPLQDTDLSRLWIVDPLDGTKEFVKRNGEFSINIALVEQGIPILGVVYAPMLQLFYQAVRGAGVFRCHENGGCVPIQVRPLATPLKVAVSRSHGGKRTDSFIAHLQNAYDIELIVRGSALKPCLVAEGNADIYPRFGKTMSWDTAAPHCIVEEAGGLVRDLHGQPLRYHDPYARNPSFVVVGDDALPWQDCLSEERD